MVEHSPLGLANTKDGAGLVKHFLSKQETTDYVKVCGKAVNRAGGQKNLMECLESLFKLSTNAAVRTNKTVKESCMWKTISKGKAFKKKALSHVNTFVDYSVTQMFLHL